MSDYELIFVFAVSVFMAIFPYILILAGLVFLILIVRHFWTKYDEEIGGFSLIFFLYGGLFILENNPKIPLIIGCFLILHMGYVVHYYGESSVHLIEAGLAWGCVLLYGLLTAYSSRRN